MNAELFAHPEWALPALATLALLGLTLLAAAQRGRRRATRFLGPRGAAIATAARRRDGVLLAAGALLALALVAPRLGERTETTTASGIDLVVLVDASRSMDARDVPPSRLRRARRIAEDVIARLAPGDRAALAAFADRGVLLTPLTPDTAALLELTAALDADLFRRRESRLGEGLAATVGAFEAESPRPRVVLLLADGEEPSGTDSLADTARALAEQRVRVVAVALGSTEGALVPDGDVALRDAAGREVVSRANPARLRRLAKATDGALLATDRFGAVEPEAAVAELRRDAGAAPGQRIERRVPATRVAPFAALALVLLLAEAWPAPARRPRATRRRGRAARASRTTALALLAGGLIAPARLAADEPTDAESEISALERATAERPSDPALLLELGLARARAERLSDASRAFLAAALSSQDSVVAATAYYDLGVSSLAAGDLISARDAFFDALALAPDDREARFNLEWTLRALAERPPPEARPAPRQGEERPPNPGARGERGDASGGREASEPSGAPTGAPPEATRRAPGPDRTQTGSAPEPARDAPARAAERAGERAPKPISAERAQQLLEGVPDVPGLALRQLTREGATRERVHEPRGAVW